MKHNIIIEDEGRIQTPGCDYGPRGLEFAHRVDNAIVLKWPGYNVFVARGEQKYHRATWIVGVVTNERIEMTDLHLEIEEVASIEVGSRPKKSLREAIKCAEQHARFRPHKFVCPACGQGFERTVDGKSEVTVECWSCGAEASYIPAADGYEPKRREGG